MQQTNVNLDNLRITEGMRESLLSAMKWLKFLTIMACIGMALVVFVGLGMLIGGDFMSKMDAGMTGTTARILGAFYFLIAALYVYPIKKAFALISNTRQAMMGGQENLEMAADDFASIMRFFGIMTIIVIGIYALAIIAMIVIGISAAVLIK